MRRLKNRKLFLVTYGTVNGEQTKVVFSKKLRAFRLAAQIRTSYFVNGDDQNKIVEIKTIGIDEAKILKVESV